MTEELKRIRGVTRDCTCKEARHEHGTYTAYVRDRCGCDDCNQARREYDKERYHAKRTTSADPGDQFVATFPYYGGWSKERIRRNGDLRARQLAAEQGVELTGPLSLRLDPTPGGGWLLVVQGPARSLKTSQELMAAAELFAYEHARIAPHLAAWADQHTRKTPAPSGQQTREVAA